jgi:antitoxin HigA-1
MAHKKKLQGPGDVLKQRIDKAGVTMYRVAVDCGLARNFIQRICKDGVAITPATAVRLARYFGDWSAEDWLAMQGAWDIAVIEDAEGKSLDALVVPLDRKGR